MFDRKKIDGRQRLHERYSIPIDKMNMNNSLTNALNDAIAKHGFRISPRLSLGDRLARYTQLYYESQGRWVDEDDARAAASMLMLKYSETNHNPRTDKMFTSTVVPPNAPRRPEPHKSKSISFTNQGTHSMTRRSQVSPHQ